MMQRLFRNPAFVTGLVVLLGLFLSSFLYLYIYEDKIPQVGLLKDENGDYLKVPYSPIDFPPLGTDNFNRNILFVILVGAKYTISIALLISVLRVIFSIFIGLVIHFYFKLSKKVIVPLIDTFNYFPQTLLAYLLLEWVLIIGPILTDDFPYSYLQQILFYIVIVVCMGIPSLSLMFSNEIDKIMKNEFIDSAKVLGASNIHLITKHLRPFMIPQFFIVMIREFITIMILISHLGMMGIFIGGATFKTDYFGINRIFTNSNEWSGLLGSWISFVWTTYPWIAFVPIVCFTIIIFAAKLILKGVENELR